MKTKRLLSLLLAGVMTSALLTGCGGDKNAASSGAADGSSSSSSASPRPAVRPPRRKTPPTTITTSREMDDPGAIGTDVPKPPKPDPTRSDDFFEDA